MNLNVHSKNPRPLVAVFLSQRCIRNLKMQKSNLSFKAQQLVSANKLARTTLFFFTIDGVDFQHSKIRGVYFDELKNIWIEKDFPFPDVVYDRVKRVKTSKLTGDELRNRFDKLGIKKINSCHCFDKWELYKLFQSHINLSRHVPVTKYYGGLEDLTEMFTQCNQIYLKACTGSRGKQVLRVTILPKGGYEVRSFVDQIVVRQVANLSDLHSLIKYYLPQRNVIVQQAIDLISKDDCIVDFRGELQRDGKGALTITAIPARVSQRFSPITTRGESYPLEFFFEELLSYSKEETTQLKTRIESFLIRIYTFLEQSYGPFGELGIDIALDKNGKLWFIECNAKSAKVSLCKTTSGETLQKAFLRPLEYARYIYEQSPSQTVATDVNNLTKCHSKTS